jgi:hypothetical protein
MWDMHEWVPSKQRTLRLELQFFLPTFTLWLILDYTFWTKTWIKTISNLNFGLPSSNLKTMDWNKNQQSKNVVLFSDFIITLTKVGAFTCIVRD